MTPSPKKRSTPSAPRTHAGQVSAAGQIPDWWATANRTLSRRDPLMRDLVRRHQGKTLASRGDPFYSLARSIVGQQISVKAAQSVWIRLEDGLGDVSPTSVGRAPTGTLRNAGLSARKAEYISDLADWFVDDEGGKIDWNEISDEEAIQILVARRGIGRWTAEMFLMFCLLRPDVLPLDDLGILRAAKEIYGRKGKDAKAIQKLGEVWIPWRSAATWHLWRYLDPVPVAY